MHRRMSLGLGFLLLLFLLFGAASASAEPLAASEPATVGALGILDQVWEWLASLLSGVPPGGSHPGGGPLDGLNGDAGVFIDPLGNG